MKRFRPFLIALIAVSFVALAVVTFSLWADYWNACGMKGSAFAAQGASASKTTQACRATRAEQAGSASGTAIAYAAEAVPAQEMMTQCQSGGSTSAGETGCAAKCAVGGKQAGTAACAAHGGSAMSASATQGGAGAASSQRAQGTASLLKPYFDMRRLLAQDKVSGLDKLSRNLVKETGKLQKSLAKANAPSEQLDALKGIERAASSMNASGLKSAREGFKGLSRSTIAYVKDYGCEGKAYSFYCDMVKESWLQETDKIGNPYYGSKMLKCGVMSGHSENGAYVAE